MIDDGINGGNNKGGYNNSYKRLLSLTI